MISAAEIMVGRRICLGVVLGAHGVKGHVRLRSFTETPEDVAAYGPLMDEAGRRFEVKLLARSKDGFLAALSGVSSREAAAALRGTRLYVDRALLPEIGEPDTFYQADLVGLSVETAQGTPLGEVRAVHDFGAGSILEVARPEGSSRLLPFTRKVVPLVDLKGGRLVVEPPEELPAAREPEAGGWTKPREEAINRGFGKGLPAMASLPWTATALTIFPEAFPGPLGLSLAGRALEKDLWRLEVRDVRAFATDRHRTVDDAPLGGGPGMVMRPDVVDAALRAVADRPGALVYLTPRGRLLDQASVRRFAAAPGVRLLCGRYEGVDQRVLEAHAVEEVSIGDYVVSGGEIAALVLLDAVVRLLPGVLGNEESPAEDSFERGLLEYPLYTRPAVWQGRAAPEVLLSGHHERVRRWRRAQAEEITRQRRPDLWERYCRKRQSGDEDESGGKEE